MPISADAALTRLIQGNRRFVASSGGDASDSDLPNLMKGRLDRGPTPSAAPTPFAIVLGCSDARVPVELVFDQGPGDLFVIRVAGQVALPSQIGSAELGAERGGARLIVVLGHSGCLAVAATLDALTHPDRPLSPALDAIVTSIRPAIETVAADTRPSSGDECLAAAVRANVLASAARLRSESEVLRRLTAEDGLEIVAAEYDVESGQVCFFDPSGRQMTEPACVAGEGETTGARAGR